MGGWVGRGWNESFLGFNFFPICPLIVKYSQILWLKPVKLKSLSLRFLRKTSVLIVINQATGNRLPDLRQFLRVICQFASLSKRLFLWVHPYAYRYLPLSITNPSLLVPKSQWVLVERSFSYMWQIPCIYFVKENWHTNFIHGFLQVLTVHLSFSQVASKSSNHFFSSDILRHLSKPKDKIFKRAQSSF